jgi:hypothetical protein
LKPCVFVDYVFYFVVRGSFWIIFSGTNLLYSDAEITLVARVAFWVDNWAFHFGVCDNVSM